MARLAPGSSSASFSLPRCWNRVLLERFRIGLRRHRGPRRLADGGSPDFTTPVSCNAREGWRCDPEQVPGCLIVDDNASFLEAAVKLLEREGVTVSGVVSTSEEALRRTRDLRPDVVLVDITLGSESGFELARRLAETASGATVILISTHAESDYVDLIAESPAAGFVPKFELSADAIRRLASDPRGR